MNVFAILLMISTVSYAAKAADAFPPLIIKDPFQKAEAVKALHELMPDLPHDVDPFLVRIRSLSYTFASQEKCTFPVLCDNRQLDKPHYLIQRTIELDISAFDRAFESALRESEEDGCSDLKFPYPKRLSTTDQQLVFIASVSAHKRACGDWPWGGNWSTDLASASGNITASVNLSVSPPDLSGLSSRGLAWMSISQPVANITNNDMLGFINPNSVFGQILISTFRIFDFHVNQISFQVLDTGWGDIEKFLSTDRIGVGITYASMSEANQIDSIFDFLAKSEDRGYIRKMYVLDVPSTRFLGATNDTRLAISSFDLVAKSAVGNYYAHKAHDVALLESLGDEPIQIEVQREDNLWRIAKKKYGIGELYYLLAGANQIKDLSAPLQPGQKLKLPPLWQLSNSEGKIVVAGDNLWKIWREYCKKVSWPEFKKNVLAGLHGAEFIYPLQLLPACK